MNKPKQRLMFVVASLVAAVLNYLLYPVLARMLSPSDFGDISAILALATQVGGIFIAFNIISIYFVEVYKEESRHKIGLIQGKILRTFAILTVGALLFYPLLKDFLNLANSFYIIPLVIVLGSSIPVALWTGYFQGKGELARVGAFNISSSLSKLVLGAIGASLWGGLGALAGITIGQIIGIIVTLLYPGTQPPHLSLWSKSKLPAGDKQFIKSSSPYISSAIAGVLLLAMLQASDLIFTKNLLSPHEAGLYAGLATLGRIIFFGGFIIVWLTLAEFKSKAKRHNGRLLKGILAALAAMSIVFILTMTLANRLIVDLLLGNNFYDQTALTLVSTFQSVVLIITFYAYSLLVRGYKFKALQFTLSTVTSAFVVGRMSEATSISILQHLIVGTVIGLLVYSLLLLLIPVRSEREQ